MARNITDMFYSHGGYLSDSAGQPDYISVDDVTATYIPQAVLRLNSVCDVTRSVDYTSMTSGNLMDDVILAELALSIADSEYDKLHVDPQTMAVENKHLTTARQYMLEMYGTMINGERVLPGEMVGSAACESMDIATLSY
jgi:hypothetical protein